MDQVADLKEDQSEASQRPRREPELATISAPTVAGPYFAGRSPFVFLLVIALIGTFATGFLTYRHIALTSHFGAAGESALCPAHGNVNCDAILQTDYAVLFGYFSSAALGLAGFVFVLWLLINALLNQRIRKLSWTFLVVYFFAAIGFSWYYAYIMMFEVDFICTWCIVVHVSEPDFTHLRDNSLDKDAARVSPTGNLDLWREGLFHRGRRTDILVDLPRVRTDRKEPEL